jgi:plasmid maintenance system antidote protein VapI
LEDILKPLGMSVNQFAKLLGVTTTRMNDVVVRGRRGIRRSGGREAPVGSFAAAWDRAQNKYEQCAKPEDVRALVPPERRKSPRRPSMSSSSVSPLYNCPKSS